MTRLFLTTVPGLAPVASRELTRLSGVTARERGNDGRADVLMVEASGDAAAAVAGYDAAEEVCVEFGRTLRAEGDAAPWIANRLWRGERIERAMRDWRALGGRARGGPITFRVVVRVLRERPFRRTELRHEVARVVAGRQPGWRAGEAAQLEVWVDEYRPGRFVGGLRVPASGSRRPVERAGSLLPSVAAAMVGLAGAPGGVLLDPCCGSGAVLAAAAARGWDTHGVDVDAAAVAAARRNAPGAAVEVGDVRRLALEDGSAAACVSNLPWGRRFGVPGPRDVWLGEALDEVARAVRTGGRVVVLTPDIPSTAVPSRLRREDRRRIQVLGEPTTLWVFRRR